MAKVLIVNDEPDLVQVCHIVLQAAGYEVAETLDGKGAVEVVRKEAPDLILLDFVLSNGTDGAKVLSQIRGDEQLRSIPVVMMSALKDGAERAIRAGADAFLPKPFKADELVDAVKRTARPH